ncbi:hypothetical protein IG631_06196 [Alternaria alternata]|nr:hypothetical protein IG631_06196 [Alternaria alternata]
MVTVLYNPSIASNVKHYCPNSQPIREKHVGNEPLQRCPSSVLRSEGYSGLVSGSCGCVGVSVAVGAS